MGEGSSTSPISEAPKDKKFSTQQHFIQYLIESLANLKMIVETTISAQFSKLKNMLVDDVFTLKQIRLKLDESIVKLTKEVKLAREMYKGDTHSTLEAT
ncbi:hypothetical protein L2E82_49696 [Cichorium intybus]|uniref:Uncharacterized protein n=1 Tax=Cichorium intybus TaxID=13427 RepID=A0ACB8Z121_CICIN|nr:hypothetical protein L2E82_49696 [Cichorium intybus]